MRRFLLLGCTGFALVVGVLLVHAEPPLDTGAAEQQRLRKFWDDHSDALRTFQEAARQDAAAKLAAQPEGTECRH